MVTLRSLATYVQWLLLLVYDYVWAVNCGSEQADHSESNPDYGDYQKQLRTVTRHHRGESAWSCMAVMMYCTHHFPRAEMDTPPY
jgi:hypothetical protein